MSTKALRRLIDENAERFDGDEPRLIREARAELEAIQETAKALCTEKLDRIALRRAAELMQTIAKDAS